MSSARRKRWIIIVASALFLGLLLSLGLFIRLRSVSAVKQLVTTLSNGQYSFDARGIRVDPFTFQVTGRNFKLYPLHPGEGNNEFELHADSLSLKLSHIFRLIFLKKLSVRNFNLVNPSLTMKVYEKDSTRQNQVHEKMAPLHVQVARMQDIFFQVLSSLQVQQFSLKNGQIAFYPDYSDSRNHYYLNHIFLEIKDLRLMKRISEWDNENRVGIRFILDHPTIRYPDSTVAINLDGLYWDSREKKFDMSGLGFHKQIKDSENDSSGFRLEGIELDSLNWNRLLTEGRVELGELKAAKGYFSSNEIRLKRNRDSTQLKPANNLLDIIGPILVKKLSIFEIEFTGNTHTKRGKEVLQINGEQLLVKDLRIDKSLPNKVELQELQLKVKAVLESDSTHDFQSGFGELNIANNNLVLKDYFLRSSRASSTGKNRINVKELALMDLSIGELVNGRLKARELVLTDPEAQLLLPKGKGKKSDFSWERIRRKYAGKMDIGWVRINNARVHVSQEGAKNPLISTDSFYAVIGSKTILRSRTIEEIFAVENSLSMPHLAIRLPNLMVDCRNARYENQSVYADLATGRSRDGNIRFTLKNISATDLNTAGILQQKDSTWIRILNIGSGDVFIRLPGKKKKADSSRSRIMQSDLIRTIHSGPLRLHLQGNGIDLRTTLDTLALEKLQQQENGWAWDSLLVGGRQLSLAKEGLNGKTGSFLFSNYGETVINQGQWEIKNDRLNASVTVPRLKVETGIHHSAEVISSLKNIDLEKPTIHLLLRKSSSAAAEGGAGAKTPLDLPRIQLLDPVIRIEKEDSAGVKQLAAAEGGRVRINTLHLEGKTVSTKGIDIDLRRISTFQPHFDLQVPFLQVATGPIRMQPGKPFSTQLEKLQLESGQLHINDGKKNIAIGETDLKLARSFRINTSPDSLKRLLSSLPHLQLSAATFLYEKRDRRFLASGLQVESANKEIRFDSLQWTSSLPRDSFFRQAVFQKDFIQMHTGKGSIRGYEMIPLAADTAWRIREMQLDRLRMLVERDKRFPPDSVPYRPLLTGSLESIPLPVAIDRIDLSNSEIRYNEIAEKNGREGTIFFNDLTATVRDARNYDISETDSLRISARTKLMGQGDLRLSFSESYTDSLKGFFMLVRMGKMPFDALSPLLQPMFNIKIERGQMDSLSLRVKANDYLAYGKMDMNYHHLKVFLLKEDGRKKAFLSRVLNTLVRTNNTRSGMVFRERMRNKSTFNYWGKIALSGLLTNMGVQKNKKAEKKYRREMLHLNLPSSLLEE